MPEKRGGSEIEQISHEEARDYLKGTYADPEAAGRFFDQLIEGRKQALDALEKEVNDDQRLGEAFARNPVGFLHERKLLGPLDQITIEGLRNPFIDWPWPWPICRIVCTLQTSVEVEWICVGIWPLRICWPVFHLRLRWVCRIVCS